MSERRGLDIGKLAESVNFGETEYMINSLWDLKESNLIKSSLVNHNWYILIWIIDISNDGVIVSNPKIIWRILEWWNQFQIADGISFDTFLDLCRKEEWMIKVFLERDDIRNTILAIIIGDRNLLEQVWRQRDLLEIERGELRTELRNKRARAREAEAEAQRLRAELDQARAETRKAESEAQRLRAELSQARAELRDARTEAEQTRNDTWQPQAEDGQATANNATITREWKVVNVSFLYDFSGLTIDRYPYNSEAEIKDFWNKIEVIRWKVKFNIWAKEIVLYEWDSIEINEINDNWEDEIKYNYLITRKKWYVEYIYLDVDRWSYEFEDKKLKKHKTWKIEQRKKCNLIIKESLGWNYLNIWRNSDIYISEDHSWAIFWIDDFNVSTVILRFDDEGFDYNSYLVVYDSDYLRKIEIEKTGSTSMDPIIFSTQEWENITIVFNQEYSDPNWKDVSPQFAWAKYCNKRDIIIYQGKRKISIHREEPTLWDYQEVFISAQLENEGVVSLWKFYIEK